MGKTPKQGRISHEGHHYAPLGEGADCLCVAALPAIGFLDGLPGSVLQLHLLPLLAPADKQALRATCPATRVLLNEVVTRACLAAGDLLPVDKGGASAPRLGHRFPALREIEAFDCSDAPVTDDGLIAFVRDCGSQLLAQLSAVDIKKCHYIGRGFLDFLKANCPGLKRLSASRWTDNVTLHAIGRLTSLEDLDLAESDALDDVGLLPLRNLGRLRVLSLQRCRWIGDGACRTLAQVPSLETLNLSSTDVGAPGLSELASLPRLRRLDVSFSRRVTDAALAGVARIPALEVLELRNTEVHSAGLAHLAGLGRLRCLDLGSRFELDDDGLASLAACSSLHSLTAGSFNLSRAPRAGFGVNLERLTIGGGFANKGLDLLFPLPRLRSLHATGIDTVTDKVMRTVSSQTSLEELSLRSGYSLTKDGLMTLQGLANLNALSVSSCPAIDDSVLAHFAGKRAFRTSSNASTVSEAAAALSAAALCPVA